MKQPLATVVILNVDALEATRQAQHRRLRDAGFEVVDLVQPSDPDELVAAVRALLRLRAAEDAQPQVHESLEARIRERTTELRQANVKLLEQIAQRERAEEALVQSQKMEAMGQLTGAIAHDFNNLLASIVGYVHVMRLKASDPQLQALADRALAAADRGNKVTARLLAFARPERPQLRAVDIRQLVEGMQDWLQQSLGRRIELTVRLGEGELVALSDPNQLELGLLNLALNARDAMPEGGHFTLDVHPHRLESPEGELEAGDYVVFDVSDTGRGMSSEVASKAFNPFFTTKPVGRGTGLGLSQVYRLGQLSRGSARIRSSQGSGTTVSLWLRAGSEDDLERARWADADWLRRGGGERILVVDDDADIRRSVGQLLSDHGYDVRLACDGEQALAALAELEFDLVVLDFAMPGLDGADVAKRLRLIKPSLPIVFLSGHADIEALEAAASGATLLRKPFGAEQIYSAVRRALAQRV